MLNASGVPGDDREGLRLQLGRGYPAQFRRRAWIPLEIPAPGPVRLTVHDVEGRVERVARSR